MACRVAVVGHGGVGKSTLASRIGHISTPTDGPSIDTAVYPKKIDVDGKQCPFEFLEIGGDEVEPYAGSAQLFVVMFSVTDADSLGLEGIRAQILKAKGARASNTMLLVGNKKDQGAARVIPPEIGTAQAEEWRCSYVECAANGDLKTVLDKIVELYKKPAGGDADAISDIESIGDDAPAPAKESTSKGAGKQDKKSAAATPATPGSAKAKPSPAPAKTNGASPAAKANGAASPALAARPPWSPATHPLATPPSTEAPKRNERYANTASRYLMPRRSPASESPPNTEALDRKRKRWDAYMRSQSEKHPYRIVRVNNVGVRTMRDIATQLEPRCPDVGAAFALVHMRKEMSAEGYRDDLKHYRFDPAQVNSATWVDMGGSWAAFLWYDDPNNPVSPESPGRRPPAGVTGSAPAYPPLSPASPSVGDASASSPSRFPPPGSSTRSLPVAASPPASARSPSLARLPSERGMPAGELSGSSSRLPVPNDRSGSASRLPVPNDRSGSASRLPVPNDRSGSMTRLPSAGTSATTTSPERSAIVQPRTVGGGQFEVSDSDSDDLRPQALSYG